ncbi:tetratricopeptide repeat protein [Bradyrhizobium sp.]|jgi:Flp pilus assembly protein TadD|uniref:tetratricopeptide repeat protein n=1 Tax=Bradyrhizobium sp. TaxID=376 RepID=UPI003C6EFF47
MKRKQFRASGSTGSSPNDSAASLHTAGLRHFQAGRFAVAEERIRRALALEPEHADSLYLAGLLQAQADKIDGAIDFIARAIRIRQDNPDYFSDLGSLLARRNRHAEAQKSFLHRAQAQAGRRRCLGQTWRSLAPTEELPGRATRL